MIKNKFKYLDLFAFIGELHQQQLSSLLINHSSYKKKVVFFNTTRNLQFPLLIIQSWKRDREGVTNQWAWDT